MDTCAHHTNTITALATRHHVHNTQERGTVGASHLSHLKACQCHFLAFTAMPPGAWGCTHLGPCCCRGAVFGPLPQSKCDNDQQKGPPNARFLHQLCCFGSTEHKITSLLCNGALTCQVAGGVCPPVVHGAWQWPPPTPCIEIHGLMGAWQAQV